MLVCPNPTHFNIIWVMQANPNLTHFTMGHIYLTHEPPDSYRMLVGLFGSSQILPSPIIMF